MRTWTATVLLALVAWTAAAQDEAVVTVTGESAYSFRQAREDALRKAVERAAGKTVFADTRVRNFRLLHDTIVSRAAGYVRSYDVARQWEEAGAYLVTVRAVVATGKIDQDWGALQVLLERKGHPVLLVVVEGAANGVHPASDTAEVKLRDLCDRLELELVDDETLAGIADAERVRAEVVGDDRKAAAVAKQLHADYCMIGRAEARAEPATKVYGITLIPVTADVAVKVVAADNAAVLASKSASARRTSREPGTAARLAVEDATAQAGVEAIDRMLERWSREIDNATAVELVGTRIDTEVLDSLVGRLSRLENVDSIRVIDHNREMTTLRVITSLEPRALAKEIPALSGGRLAVTGFSGRKVTFAMTKEERARERLADEAAPGVRLDETNAPSPETPRASPTPLPEGDRGGTSSSQDGSGSGATIPTRAAAPDPPSNLPPEGPKAREVRVSLPALVAGGAAVVVAGVLLGVLLSRRR